MQSIEVKNLVGLEKYVTEWIHELGVPAHIKGYHYVREAVMMAVKDYDTIFQITKIMYPDLARKFNTTPSRVERAIKHAIEISWSRANQKVLDEMFRYTIDPEKGKPTNAEYISIIADKARLDVDSWNN